MREAGENEGEYSGRSSSLLLGSPFPSPASPGLFSPRVWLRTAEGLAGGS